MCLKFIICTYFPIVLSYSSEVLSEQEAGEEVVEISVLQVRLHIHVCL